MPPPVASAVKIRETMPFTVDTRETAAIAASPTRETSIVVSTLMI